MATNSIFNVRRVLTRTAIVSALAIGGVRAETPLAVDITTQLGDHQIFSVGDEIRLIYSINAPAQLLAIYQDASGALWQLLPSDRFPNSTAKAGRYQAFPATNSPLRLIAQPPIGKESIWLFASRKPFPALTGTVGANGTKRLNYNDVSTVQNALNTQLGTDYASSRVDYEIRD